MAASSSSHPTTTHDESALDLCGVSNPDERKALCLLTHEIPVHVLRELSLFRIAAGLNTVFAPQKEEFGLHELKKLVSASSATSTTKHEVCLHFFSSFSLSLVDKLITYVKGGS